MKAEKATESRVYRSVLGLTAVIPVFAGMAAAQPNSPSDTAENARLEVTVTGLRSSRGQLAIALFASESDYNEQTNAVRRAFLPIVAGRSTWQLSDLPAGRYALIAYHDENGNREIDMRIFGMPKEAVGVSNDARGVFGPPGFDAASFELTAPYGAQSIRMR